MGFGASVIQRLCKTSVKKNLYWEVKDKVIEEAFNGIRSAKVSKKVRVYGTDSTREVRARLIEILYDRVALHKDKFVAPILHQEMKAMEIKKSGKVEHSDNSHDDQVFSYLMALYVWYDGQNLAERYHIIKNTIKTDQDEDLEELEIEDSLEANTRVNIDTTVAEEGSNLDEAMKFVEQNSKIITSQDFATEQKIKDLAARDALLASDKNARDAYCRENGLDPSMFNSDPNGGNYVSLPDQLFTDTDFDDTEYDYDGNPVPKDTYLVGNLSNWYDKV